MRHRTRLAALVLVISATAGSMLGSAARAAAVGPVVTGLSVTTGSTAGGDTVVVHGSGFEQLNVCNQNTTVAFGNANQPHAAGTTTAANDATGVQVVSDTAISVVTPGSNAGVVDVIVANACGTSSPTPADRFTFDSQPRCASTCTITVDATAARGAMNHVAAGLLHGYPPSLTPSATLLSELQALHLSHWRVSSHDFLTETLPHQLGVPTIEIISDDWYATHGTDPWNDLATWRSYIQTLVQDPTPQPVDYWDIYNEPGTTFRSGQVAPDMAQQLAMFDVAYNTIKSVNPNIKMVAPSTGYYHDSLSQSGPPIDLSTFLDHAQQMGESFDAISWHEINDIDPGWQPYRLDAPRYLIDDVNRARALLAAHPVMAHAAIFVDEYGAPDTHNSPGWAAGYIAAFEDAGVTEAGRSCWNIVGTSSDECHQQFDGLFAADEQTPQPLYWVYRRYGDESGTRVAVSSSALDLSGVAAFDGGNVLRAVIGRHVDCGVPPLPYATASPPADVCPNGTASGRAGPATVTVDLVLPPQLAQLASVQVTLELIPNQTGTLPTLTPVTSTVAVVNGVASVAATMADGDALAVTVSQ